MGDIIGKVEGERGLLERIADKIPGFRGYLDKEKRRDADKLLRDAIAARFEAQVRRLPDLQMELINAGRLEYVDDVERAVVKLQTFVDRVKTTTRGYAGFFDAIKVKEDELEQLYHWDEQLLNEAEKIALAIDALAAAIGSSGDTGAAVRELIGAATAINELYSQREHVLVGVA
ncbi:MAG TPA: hypothetical protein VJG32_17720 [Anaerolineae bacterium]|nr:hypothetical protein [Anaerolineae bacterium]